MWLIVFAVSKKPEDLSSEEIKELEKYFPDGWNNMLSGELP